ncbi:MAG: DUF4331 family protein [Deltaproteobacteria bacterium]|nr:DUF4331 family protein [Deltaproteobacteria bacterium]
MKLISTSTLLLGALVGLVACGDNIGASDPRVDAPKAIDAPLPPPLPPTLGAQVDRMGRPAINTALNQTFVAPTATTRAAKDTYNQDTAIATWAATNRAEFAKNLGIIDLLDKTAVNPGCGNQVLYNGGAGGAPMATSYFTLGSVLANDQLFVDTAKTSCTKYLSVEFEVALPAVVHTQCGGRTPTHDVIDVSYSALAAGLAGFSQTLDPIIGDGVAAHADLSDSVFPYFGAPH